MFHIPKSEGVLLRNHMIVHGGEREPQPETAVSFRTVVTFVTWLISTTEFSSLELVL